MAKILELFIEAFREAIIQMVQKAIANSLKMNGKIKISANERRYKEQNDNKLELGNKITETYLVGSTTERPCKRKKLLNLKLGE